ncbi:hypothetical protein NKR23_g4242 [Pleurostoma richardsiae]|uniref:Uncharacterized protein n=1 Tax=Pleurostoma richardsiae TaxID=41990 RepID=A0AA38S285_9PEZI|nr:hypothetical protein NKR23_g4242 [Pleurostoma richardsiae]
MTSGVLSPVPAYLFGTAFLGVGLQAFANPTAAYELFGAPLASSSPDTVHPAAAGSGAALSPFLYAKAARDVSIGLAYLLLQRFGTPRAVTALSAAVAVTGFVDGWAVWKSGGGGAEAEEQQAKRKAWSHWIGSAVFTAWVAMRVAKHQQS